MAFPTKMNSSKQKNKEAALIDSIHDLDGTCNGYAIYVL
jgi:hypothetical protein